MQARAQHLRTEPGAVRMSPVCPQLVPGYSLYERESLGDKVGTEKTQSAPRLALCSGRLSPRFHELRRRSSSRAAQISFFSAKDRAAQPATMK